MISIKAENQINTDNSYQNSLRSERNQAVDFYAKEYKLTQKETETAGKAFTILKEDADLKKIDDDKLARYITRYCKDKSPNNVDDVFIKSLKQYIADNISSDAVPSTALFYPKDNPKIEKASVPYVSFSRKKYCPSACEIKDLQSNNSVRINGPFSCETDNVLLFIEQGSIDLSIKDGDSFLGISPERDISINLGANQISISPGTFKFSGGSHNYRIECNNGFYLEQTRISNDVSKIKTLSGTLTITEYGDDGNPILTQNISALGIDTMEPDGIWKHQNWDEFYGHPLNKINGIIGLMINLAIYFANNENNAFSTLETIPFTSSANLSKEQNQLVNDILKELINKNNISASTLSQAQNMLKSSPEKVKLAFIQIIADCMQKWNYDNRQRSSGDFKEVSADNMLNSSLNSMQSGKEIPSQVCAGIHNALGNLAIALGFPSVTFTTMTGEAHVQCLVLTTNGFIIFNYGDIFETGTFDIREAIELANCINGNTELFTRIYDPKTGKYITTISSATAETVLDKVYENDGNLSTIFEGLLNNTAHKEKNTLSFKSGLNESNVKYDYSNNNTSIGFNGSVINDRHDEQLTKQIEFYQFYLSHKWQPTDRLDLTLGGSINASRIKYDNIDFPKDGFMNLSDDKSDTLSILRLYGGASYNFQLTQDLNSKAFGLFDLIGATDIKENKNYDYKKMQGNAEFKLGNIFSLDTNKGHNLQFYLSSDWLFMIEDQNTNKDLVNKECDAGVQSTFYGDNYYLSNKLEFGFLPREKAYRALYNGVYALDNSMKLSIELSGKEYLPLSPVYEILPGEREAKADLSFPILDNTLNFSLGSQYKIETFHKGFSDIDRPDKINNVNYGSINIPYDSWLGDNLSAGMTLQNTSGSSYGEKSGTFLSNSIGFKYDKYEINANGTYNFQDNNLYDISFGIKRDF